MNELKREQLAVQQERSLLVGVILPDSNIDPDDPLGELRSLARTAKAIVVDEMVCKRQSISPALYVGSGKAREIAERAEMNEIDTIIFDNDLTPAQMRDLEKITDRKIIDRSELILDIFAAHARTSEARLQVELAQLEYTYPRLRNMWSHLERIGGGSTANGGIGTRGMGEKQIEVDRRLVQKRVSFLKRQIAQIDKRKQRQVKARDEIFTACLVGYTNAGKSTIMSRLTGADVYVADKLFATLDTRTRKWDLPTGEHCLLSDTVGFVRDLPHHLVASFRATLEEAINADLLMHVADASRENCLQQIEAVNSVLDELECDRSRCLMVLNKVDRIKDPANRVLLRQQFPEAIFTSAASGEGLDELAETVGEMVGGGAVQVTLRANCVNGQLMNYIAQHAEVQNQTFEDTTACIDAIIPSSKLDLLKQFGDDVSIHPPVSG
ncbi:MAG: GTPase HflX [Phycisphaerae bacterium]